MDLRGVGMHEILKVLVVEDEQDLRELLKIKLEAHGMTVFTCDRGDMVISSLEKNIVDLILLDQVMPGKHGLDVLKDLRSHSDFKMIPVIMVTGLGGEGEKIQALDSGADDYVTKPFFSRELAARIKAVLRRSQGKLGKTQPNQLMNKNITLDFVAHKTFLDGNELDLTLTEFKLLGELLVNAGKVISRDHLRDKVLSRTGTTDRTIDVHMAALRKKLGNRGRDIQTVRGVGYRFSGSSLAQL